MAPCEGKELIAPIENLNEDLLIKILVRFPIEFLHQCKCVSKRWFALISNPYFVNFHTKLHFNIPHHDDFIVYKDMNYSVHNHKPLGKYMHFPLSKQVVESINIHEKFDFSLKFLPILRDCPKSYSHCRQHSLKSFNILATCHGLLFCKAEFKRYHCSPRNRTLYVCNPLTKHWLKLPRLDLRYNYPIVIEGFMCYTLNPIDYRVGFIVLEVERKDSPNQKLFNTHVFSSETGAWSSYVVACPPGLQWLKFRVSKACNGKFHWYANNFKGIVAYDPINEPFKCRLIKLPQEVSKDHVLPNCVEVSEGHIRISTFSWKNDKFFDVWELMDYDKGIWCLKYHVENPIGSTRLLSETYGEIVYLANRSTRKLILFNMKSGSQQCIDNTPFGFVLSENYINDLLYNYKDGTLPFVMTPWPTPIPKLPYKDQHD